MADADRWTGRTIDNRYVVESTIGAGGMGVVLRAKHKFTGAQVAIKMLLPEVQVNPQAQDRFLAEARTPTTIGHPGIVQVFDAGKTPEGELYLAMELLTGQTLRQAMYPPMAPQVARRVILDLLDALAAAHARGIIHRDLKPENVYLSGPTQTVKLLDFGIAKVLETTRTAAGAMMGTVTYMAPEQLTDASSVDARADLWAVGVMLYEMLCGRLPFPGTTLGEIITSLSTRQPDSIKTYMPSATPGLEQFFSRALAKDRNERFGSAQELAVAVSAAQLDGTSPDKSTLSGLGDRRMLGLPTPSPMTPQTGPGFGSPVAAQSVPPGYGSPVAAQPLPPLAASPVPPPASPFPSSPPPQPMQPAVPFVQPSTGPIQWNNSWSQDPAAAMAKKQAAAGGKSHLIVVGGALALIVLMIAVVTIKFSGTKKAMQMCEDTCKELQKTCGASADLCESKCVLSDKAEKCVENSNGNCAAYTECIDQVDRARFKKLFDKDPDDFGKKKLGEDTEPSTESPQKVEPVEGTP